MRGHPIHYSAAELAWLEANRTLPVDACHLGFVDRFERADVTAANLVALRKRKGWPTGRTGRFVKGQVPVNKGKPAPYHPASAATRFRPGNRTGVAARTYKPIGTERVAKGGYIQRKVNDDLPFQARWRFVHLIRWEERHGPLPAGHALKCLDGDPANTDPANWQAVPRALLPRLNGRYGRGYEDAPAAVKPIILAVTQLEHAVRTRRTEARNG